MTLLRAMTMIALIALACHAQAGTAAFDGKHFPALPDGDGGLAGLAEKDVAVIRKARDLLKGLAANPRESYALRKEAVIGLRRLHEALCDWGREGQLEWYIECLFAEQVDYVRRELADNAQAAARARQAHLGGARALWRHLDALAKSKGVNISNDLKHPQSDLEYCARGLRSAADLDHKIRPYEIKDVNLNIKNAVKPYPVPKEKKKK